MAHALTMPSEGQILVNIDDMSMIKDIKKAISYSSYELSMRDLEEGNVFVAEDADDLMRQCLEE
jgi:ribosome recycling factor